MTSSIWSASDGPWRGSGVAIVGMAGRFPMADSVDAFWHNLLEGRDCISRFTRDELLREGVAPELLDHVQYVRAGAVLDGIDLFDAAFFGISPREAESMDPQQRLFLEVVQHAFDDAALDPQRYPGRIAIYAGERLSGYWLRLMKNTEFMARLGWHQVAAGNDKDFLATQASFRFDLRGPSASVQAACSTSLLAVSMGCDALMSGRCDVALAGAASIAVPHRIGYMYQPSGIASSDGQCRPFDARANGSVLGNAVAAVVLKRIDDALADGDRIVAVLRAVAVNNDGSSKSSFAAPSVRAQADVVKHALLEAGLSPDDITYIETHGTATLLGDPIEIEALARVFRPNSVRKTPLLIGSVKSNVGHLDPVAGLASLIKASLCLYEHRIPASLHFEQPNPAIDFTSAGIRVVTEVMEYPVDESPRRAGVSAFGIGGTNVHVVVEEAPLLVGVDEKSVVEQQPELLILSAKSPDALNVMTHDLGAALSNTASPRLRDVAFTLARGRRQFNHRRYVVANSPQEAATFLRQDATEIVEWIKDRPVVFLFPGQGSQRMGMGLSLYRTERVFREAVDKLLGLAEPHLGFDARELIDAAAHGGRSQKDLTQTAIAQPLLFALEVACARLWMHWGVQPVQMLGHSVGELVAAHVSGVLRSEDAMSVVCQRGSLMQSMAPGAMVAVPLGPDEATNLVQELALEDVSIAAFNSPRLQTLSGTLEAVERIEVQLQARGIKAFRLPTSHAFHHRSMRKAADGLRRVLHDLILEAPTCDLMSCVSGERMTNEQATDPDYWASSIVLPVHFAQAAQVLLSSYNEAVFIECGPGRALGSMLRNQGGGEQRLVLSTLPTAGDFGEERRNVLTALGKAWACGVNINWNNVWQYRPGRRTKLPGYAFQRKRFWVDVPLEDGVTSKVRSVVEESGSNIPVASTPPAQRTFVRVWAPSSDKINTHSGGRLGADFVLLTADVTFGVALAKQVKRKERDVRIIVLHPGQGLSLVPTTSDEASVSGIHILNADIRDPSVFESLTHRIASHVRSDSPIHLVNVWPLAIPPGTPSVARAEEGAWLSFHAPLRLLQSLRIAKFTVTMLDTVTTRLFPLLPGEWPEPVTAPALGLVRVLPQEIPGVRARVIDFVLPNATYPSLQLEQLVEELLHPNLDPVIAYRGSQRLVETFVPSVLPCEQPRLRQGGSYLITGGFGAIGGVLAASLAQASPGARITLVSRRGLGKEGSAARQLVTSLERMGAEVFPITADMSEPQVVRSVVEQTLLRFGRIDGVVHCAGVAGGRMLMVPEISDAGKVMAPKVKGTVALLEAVAPQAPDFVLLCSSFASVSGGVGQGEYCAANAFLDAMAWSGRAMGLRVTAVNWPAWREAGMAVEMSLPPELEHLRHLSLATGISSSEGVELFMRILAADLPQVVIAPSSTSGVDSIGTMQVVSGKESRRVPPINEMKQQAHVPGDTVGRQGTLVASSKSILPGQRDEAGEIKYLLIEHIGTIWSDILGVPPPKASDNFFEFGGQSIMALQIVSRCSEQFGISVALTDVFDHPTLGGFVDFVHRRVTEHVAVMPDAEVRERLAAAGS